MKKHKESDEKRRTLLVSTAKDGQFKIEIPDGAKLTFGPAIPFGKGERYSGVSVSEYALRIYQGSKENLIAVFTGVREFRDIDMPISKKVTSEAGKTLWKSDEGGYEVTQAVKKKSKFVDVKQLEGGHDEEAF